MYDLIKKYEAAQKELNNAAWELREFSDGYVYLVVTHCFGYTHWRLIKNDYAVDMANRALGDGQDGIMNVYTNNPDHAFSNWSGDTVVMSKEQICALTEEDTGLSTKELDEIRNLLS